jgi:hypothetical protein
VVPTHTHGPIDHMWILWNGPWLSGFLGVAWGSLVVNLLKPLA